MERISSFLENSSFFSIQSGLWGSNLTLEAFKDSIMILENNFLQFANSISLITSFQLLLYSKFHLHLVTYLCYNYLQLIWEQNSIFNFLFNSMTECYHKFKKYFNFFEYFIKLNSNYYFIDLFYLLLCAFSFLFLFFIIYSVLVRGQFYLSH
jgi:hypothetical protein